MKPVIGVVPLLDGKKGGIWMVPGYTEGIRRTGGIPMMPPLTWEKGDLEQIGSMCRDYLFAGGHDMTSRLYGETESGLRGPTSRQRDQPETYILHLAWNDDRAILGICRGLQLINVLMGGTLCQDLPSQFQGSKEMRHHMCPPYDRPCHQMKLTEGGPLFRLLEKRGLGVNSYHHQGIKKLAPGLGTSVVAEDGLVEGIYARDKRYIQAIQWHPEFMGQEDRDSGKVFREFIKGCK